MCDDEFEEFGGAILIPADEYMAAIGPFRTRDDATAWGKRWLWDIGFQVKAIDSSRSFEREEQAA